MISVTGSERDHAVFISTGGERGSIHKSIFETITIEGGRWGADEPSDIYIYIYIYFYIYIYICD